MSVQDLLSNIANPTITLTLPSGANVEAKSTVSYSSRLEVMRYGQENKAKNVVDVMAWTDRKMVSTLLSCSMDDAKKLQEALGVDDWLAIMKHCNQVYYPDHYVEKKVSETKSENSDSSDS